MEVKREKQTDLSGTIGDFTGINNISENTEIDENSPEYKKWREKGKAIIIPSDARIEKIVIETTNKGEQERRSRSLRSTSKNKGEKIANKSTREEQENVIIDGKKENAPKSSNGREIDE